MSINSSRDKHLRYLIGSAALLLVVTSAPASAQAVLDWPLLLEARPIAAVTGSGAVLGNPAGLAELDGDAEALVSDLETPEAMGLRALTVAGAIQLFDRWSVGAAYRHVGVGDMLRTSGPPLGPGSIPFEIGEDVFALGTAFRFGDFTAGLAARLDTPADELGGEDALAGTVGGGWTPPLAVGALRFAASLEVEEDETMLAGAAEFTTPAILDERLALALAWGAQQSGPLGISHSIVASGLWQGFAELQVGATAQPGVAERDWVPLLAGLLHLGRYRLGIVREHLPNDFGAAMHYRLSVVF